MRFQFATASRIVFGRGTIKEAGPAARDLGSRVLIVTGRSRERSAALIAALESSGLSYVTFSATGEPTTAMMRDGVRLACAEACDVVIGFGGGSAIDAAKAIATLVANGGDPLDYMEGIGAGKPLTQPALPIIAIPTTAGTGAEVTRECGRRLAGASRQGLTAQPVHAAAVGARRSRTDVHPSAGGHGGHRTAMR